MFDLIKIDFINITFLDVFDIIVLAYLFYLLFRTLQGTIASQIFVGLIIMLFLSFTAKALNMKATGFILKLLTDIWVIAFVILFQPELRKLLISVSQSKFIRLFIKNDFTFANDEIIGAVVELSQKQHGALIVISKTTGLRGVVETGVPVHSQISKFILMSIFYPKSPLHDGAVVLKNGIIEAARCTLPLSSKNMVNGFQLGMRHKAALGISELSDAMIIVVSEETGMIAIAENGILRKPVSVKELEESLKKAYSQKLGRNWRSIFKNIKQNEKFID